MKKKTLLMHSKVSNNTGMVWSYINRIFHEVANIVNSNPNQDQAIISFTKIVVPLKSNSIELPSFVSLNPIDRIKFVSKIYCRGITNLVLINPPQLSLAYFICRLLKIKVIAHYHSTGASSCKTSNKFKNGINFIMFKTGFVPHLQIFVSNALREEFVRDMGRPSFSRLVVRHNAFIKHTDKFNIEDEIKILPNKKLVIMDCRMVKMKGIEIFLKALHLLDIKLKSSIQAIILGNGDALSYFQTVANDLKLNDVVSFAGEKPIEYIQALKINAFFVVCPSQCEEGFCLSAFDALSLGIPVIASRKGGFPEIITHGINGLLYEPCNDPGALKSAMETLLINPDLRIKMSNSISILDNTHPLRISLEQHIKELASLYCS